MKTREIIGIIIIAIGFAASFFAPQAALLIIAGPFVYGKNRLALILLAGGLRGMFQPNAIISGLVIALIGAVLILKNHFFPFGFALTENGKRKFNPFTGKKHHNRVNDDEFLTQSANEYYQVIGQSQLLDDTQNGQMMMNVSKNLIEAVERYLKSIKRADFTQNYYGGDFSSDFKACSKRILHAWRKNRCLFRTVFGSQHRRGAGVYPGP